MKTILFLVMLTLQFSMAFAQNYGTFTDSRDGKTYKTIQIGDQTWMAENLKFESKNGSCCYEHEDFLCETYGRLYTYKVANYACPIGWHLPSDNEFDRLLENIGGEEQYRKLLKGGGSGFDALFGGTKIFFKVGVEEFREVGKIGCFWAISTQKSDNNDGFWLLFHTISPSDFRGGYTHGNDFMSVRCIKD